MCGHWSGKVRATQICATPWLKVGGFKVQWKVTQILGRLTGCKAAPWLKVETPCYIPSDSMNYHHTKWCGKAKLTGMVWQDASQTLWLKVETSCYIHTIWWWKVTQILGRLTGCKATPLIKSGDSMLHTTCQVTWCNMVPSLKVRQSWQVWYDRIQGKPPH